LEWVLHGCNDTLGLRGQEEEPTSPSPSAPRQGGLTALRSQSEASCVDLPFFGPEGHSGPPAENRRGKGRSAPYPNLRRLKRPLLVVAAIVGPHGCIGAHNSHVLWRTGGWTVADWASVRTIADWAAC